MEARSSLARSVAADLASLRFNDRSKDLEHFAAAASSQGDGYCRRHDAFVILDAVSELYQELVAAAYISSTAAHSAMAAQKPKLTYHQFPGVDICRPTSSVARFFSSVSSSIGLAELIEAMSLSLLGQHWSQVLGCRSTE